VNDKNGGFDEKKNLRFFFFNILRNCAFAVLARILAQITEPRLRDDLVFAYTRVTLVCVCIIRYSIIKSNFEDYERLRTCHYIQS